jgi:hypothetical protein
MIEMYAILHCFTYLGTDDPNIKKVSCDVTPWGKFQTAEACERRRQYFVSHGVLRGTTGSYDEDYVCAKRPVTLRRAQ